MICALSDGASVSFDSGPWAEILSRRFVESPNISQEWIKAAIEEYRSAYDRENMSWAYQAAYDRGSFATLLGIISMPNGRGLRVFAYGDTLLALIENGQLVRTIPYIRADEFDRSPNLISTSLIENHALDDDAISESWHDLAIAMPDAPTLLLMTDAIGRWLLDEPEPSRVGRLLNIHEPEAFATFIASERAQGRMRRDDSTLVVVG
jgi:hypothetical protein